jgi:6-pyruvoyltetrahydropterin/6-carboxytetrahydropterin synthase
VVKVTSTVKTFGEGSLPSSDSPVRTELSKTFSLEAAHRLPNVPADHKCARLHGHSFEVTLHIGGPVDPQLGWVIDFADITKAFAPLHDLLDHRYLNEVDGLANPTSENLARFILERLKLPVGSSARVSAVTVAETCTSSCTVYADRA